VPITQLAQTRAIRSGTMSVGPALFRQEAIEFQQRHRRWGNVAALQPVSTKIVAWLLAVSATAILFFLLVAQYSRKEVAVGYLTPTTGTAKIFAPHRGTIQRIYVQEGDRVEEGQPLLAVETNQIAADGVDVNASMLDTLLAQRELLAKNIAGEERRATSEGERLTALLRGLQSEVAEIEGQIKIQGERLRVVESDMAAAEQLRAKGIMAEGDFRRRQIMMLEQRQAAAALNQQIAARKNQVTETEFSLHELPTVMAQKIQALRNDLAATEQRIAEINGRRAYVVRAPTTGRISTLQATVGQNVDPQRLQLEIIPEDAVLQAELFVPARAIGFVEPGQAVRILYDAFPYQHFGTYSGHVVKISQTILTGSDARGPIALKEPAYRVIAALDRADIDAAGKKVPLQPDMLLRADIILEKRSLMSWLISPLTGVRM
jgi:membrane fusion protein